MKRLAGSLRKTGICCLAAAACVFAAAQEPAEQTTPQSATTPIAIVTIDNSATVSGALQVTAGKAIIGSSGTVTSGAKTADVVLPSRGTLHVCAATTVKLAAGSSAAETPGLMMALDHGAIEASLAEGRTADVLLTPDFRIGLDGAGAAELDVRLGEHGDTCIDNAKSDAPNVLVTSVWDGGTYTVRAGQRVMFQHGSLQEVVDQEKEPCGCPPEPRPGSNDFPVAQSAGMAPLAPAAPAPIESGATASKTAVNEQLVYQAPPAEPAKAPAPQPAQSDTAQPAKPAQQKKTGFFHRLGSFFRRIFGAES